MISPPPSGAPITLGSDGLLRVPDDPVIPFIEGDGAGPEIRSAARQVLEAAVEKAYGSARRIHWFEIFAGEKALDRYGELLPQDTIDAISEYHVALKGPLAIPREGEIRNLNIALRQRLDLFACVRPIRHFRGVPAPVRNPQNVNLVIFRENTEDLHGGVEWVAGSAGARRVIQLARELGFSIREDSGIAIKSMSSYSTKRLVRMAIRHAIEHGLPHITLVHKASIMKFTEGAFRDWSYELASEEFPVEVISEAEIKEKHEGKCPSGKIVLRDRTADSMFQQLLFRPGDYSVIVLPNLNGDFLSDAAAAQVGGLGLSPRANRGETCAIFEVNHGVAPRYAGKDMVNPGSLILSGVMMLEHMGWEEAGGVIIRALERTISGKTVTYDLERLIPGATRLKCSEFAQAMIDNMD